MVLPPRDCSHDEVGLNRNGVLHRDDLQISPSEVRQQRVHFGEARRSSLGHQHEMQVRRGHRARSGHGGEQDLSVGRQEVTTGSEDLRPTFELEVVDVVGSYP